MEKDTFWILFAASLLFGFIGRYISVQKNRNKKEGFIFGFFLSVLGLLIISLLPSNSHSLNIEKHKYDKKYKVEKKPIGKNRLYTVFLLIIILIIFFYTGFTRGDFK